MSERKRPNYRSRLANKNIDDDNVILAPIDSSLLILIAFLCMFGLMAVFSAGAPVGLRLYNNPAYFAIRQFSFMIIGLILMVTMAKYDYKKLKEKAIPMAGIIIAFLAIIVFSSLGKSSNGASRWLTFLPVQPSEFAKLACIMLTAAAMVDIKTLLNEKTIARLGIVAVTVVLIFMQPNLSMAILISATTAVMMLAGGVNFSLLLAAAGCVAPLAFFKMHAYQLQRILSWQDPWADPQNSGYNLIQSWYAIASGGIFGVGFGHSKQKLFWLPFGHTDFIFAVISEEFGLLGCLVLLGLFVALIHRGFFIANRCPDMFGKLLAFGITFQIGFQAFLNVAVTTGVMPVTGVTLPLVSYGGSSVIITMTMVGVLLNISRKRIKRIIPHEA